MDNPGTGSGFAGTPSNNSPGFTYADPFNVTNAYTDGIFNNDTASTITFTGLTGSTDYTFKAVGGRDDSTSNGTITISVGTSSSSSYSLLDNGTVSQFTVKSNESGSIVLEFVRDGSGTANFNALEMTQVPEPRAALLGGIGLLILLRGRR